ncbi:MAG: hypothetical protein AAFO91_13545, partial [Bacteroidota bacterium]
SNLWGYDDFVSAGFDNSILGPVSSHFFAANKNPIRVVGAFAGVSEGITPNGKAIACRAMVYVSDRVTGIFCGTLR